MDDTPRYIPREISPETERKMLDIFKRVRSEGPAPEPLDSSHEAEADADKAA